MGYDPNPQAGHTKGQEGQAPGPQGGSWLGSVYWLFCSHEAGSVPQPLASPSAPETWHGGLRGLAWCAPPPGPGRSIPRDQPLPPPGHCPSPLWGQDNVCADSGGWAPGAVSEGQVVGGRAAGPGAPGVPGGPGLGMLCESRHLAGVSHEHPRTRGASAGSSRAAEHGSAWESLWLRVLCRPGLCEHPTGQGGWPSRFRVRGF